MVEHVTEAHRLHGGRIVLPSSLAMILMTVAFTAGAVAMLVLVWRKGFMRDFDAQSRSIFEPRDLRLVREWEGPVDRLEREMRFGAPLRPARGEWGGARGGDDDAPPPPAAA